MDKHDVGFLLGVEIGGTTISAIYKEAEGMGICPLCASRGAAQMLMVTALAKTFEENPDLVKNFMADFAADVILSLEKRGELESPPQSTDKRKLI